MSLLAGCQGARPIEHKRLIEHQALIDFSGLKSPETLEPVQMLAGVPESWNEGKPQKTSLYTHAQWKSPSGHTAVGAVLVRLPLPLSPDTVVWFAKREYTKKAEDGRLISEWKDDLGRRWFEAENNKYRVRGYCLAQGFRAWIVYFGYKTAHPPNFDEISLAARSADTFVPRLGDDREEKDASPAETAPTKPQDRPTTQPSPVAGR